MRIVLAAFVIATIGSLRAASAQPTTAQAEVLFREGKRLMAEGNVAAACDAFEGSFNKDGSPATLMNLADCREKNQQYASAWAHFVETARLSRMNPVLGGLANAAQERAAAVEARLSYLIISVPDEARVEGLSITRNGVPVDPVEWNRDIPVDGGKHVIEAKAPAFEAWSATITIENARDKESVNVPRFREALPGADDHEARRETGSRLTGKRKLALGLGVLALGALGGGLAFELRSGGTYDDAKAAPTNDERHALTDEANTERRTGIALAAGGILAAGLATYLWVSGKPETHPAISFAPHVHSGGAALVLAGRF